MFSYQKATYVAILFSLELSRKLLLFSLNSFAALFLVFSFLEPCMPVEQVLSGGFSPIDSYLSSLWTFKVFFPKVGDMFVHSFNQYYWASRLCNRHIEPWTKWSTSLWSLQPVTICVWLTHAFQEVAGARWGRHELLVCFSILWTLRWQRVSVRILIANSYNNEEVSLRIVCEGTVYKVWTGFKKGYGRAMTGCQFLPPRQG